jgi:hypothetical protein
VTELRVVTTDGHIVEEDVGILRSTHEKNTLRGIQSELLALGRPTMNDEDPGPGGQIQLTACTDGGGGARTRGGTWLEHRGCVLDALEVHGTERRTAGAAEAIVRGREMTAAGAIHDV